MKNSKDKIKGFIAGMLAMAVVMAVGTAIASTQRNISVIFRDIRIVVDGQEITLRDAHGNVVEPFIFEGSTFLPVRAVSEALGYAVSWDDETSTVFIGDIPRQPGDIRIALVAAFPQSILFDGSFNEAAHDGIQQFIAAHNVPSANFQFFIAVESNDDARLDQIETAIEVWGADIVILPNMFFVHSAYWAQQYWPDTKFIVLDVIPAYDGVQRTDSNTVAALYAEEQAGFLAGYAAVREGFRNLGFMGGVAASPIVRYGHGFVQGAEHAARSLGLAQGEVSVMFHYLGGFSPDPAHTALTLAWFDAGVEVIFAAASGAGWSVLAAAEQAGAYFIGVDVDQSNAAHAVITSAMKGIASSVNDLLEDFAADTFPGGSVVMFDAAANGVALPMQTSRFVNFTQAQYDAIFNQLAYGEITVSSSLDMEIALADVSLVRVLT